MEQIQYGQETRSKHWGKDSNMVEETRDKATRKRQEKKHNHTWGVANNDGTVDEVLI